MSVPFALGDIGTAQVGLPDKISGGGGGGGGGRQTQQGKQIRKRVKTGCLTCRRRRIKCGEQKPSCANCVRSGRECDYSTRGNTEASSLPRVAGAESSSSRPSPGDERTPSWSEQGHPALTIDSMASREADLAIPPQIVGSTPVVWGHSPTHGTQQPGMHMQPWQTHPTQGMAYHPGMSQAVWYGQPSPIPVGPYAYHRLDTQAPPLHEGQSVAFNSPDSSVTPGFSTPSTAGWTANAPPSPYAPTLPLPQPQLLSHRYSAGSIGAETRTPATTAPGRSWSAHAPMESRYGPRFAAASVNPARPDFNNLLEVAAVEVQDDDYYDIFPEEENMDDALDTAQRQSLLALQHMSGPAFARQPPQSQSMAVDVYRSETAANPLRNPATTRVFGHFVNYTGPALSVFERPVGQTNPDVGGERISEHRRTSWMYALPSLALHDNGLLHAMLAVASYAMAKARGANTTPSVKHHSWSIRRVHRSLGEPGKRQQITTLAATLLLGFYEIMTADHMKWSAHLSGAKQLIMESTHRTVTSKILKLKAEQPLGRSPGQESRAAVPSNLAALDFALLEKLFNRRLPRPDASQRQSTGRVRQLSALEWNEFALFQDLYWFFVRQDMIYALISGNGLMLPFDQYLHVLPRGPVGKRDAVWGTFDHLLILLGRIADFAVRDRERKIRMIKARRESHARANHGQMPPGPDPSAVPRDASGMPFYGMAPGATVARMPSAYNSTGPYPPLPQDSPAPAPPPPPLRTARDHEPSARAAVAEWEEIQDTLRHFASLLGPCFRPLQEPDNPSFDTAFGRAVLYPSYEIASLWMYYYMAMIVLIRAHPTRPPAAQVAVGAAAAETAWFANEVGRIAAGILPSNAPDQHPAFLGALASSMTPLFFAGVQFIGTPQRLWTVRRLCEISATCGWTTAEMCANGCETSWSRAAERGAGPPWTKVRRDFGSLDPRSSPGRVLVIPDSNLDALGKPRLQKAFGIIGEVNDLEFEHLRI